MTVVGESAGVLIKLAVLTAVECSVLPCNEFTTVFFVDGVWADGTIRVATLGGDI